MKKIMMALALIFSTLTLCRAQSDFQPTTTWPYIYNDFTDGVIHLNVGNEKTGKYNVCISNGRLHFIDGETVKEASSSDVFSVKIGNDIFENVNGRLMKVIAKTDNGIVVKDLIIDEVKLNATGGAYGSSSSSNGTMALSSLEGVGSKFANMNHMELKANKENGKVLPLIEKKYLFVKGYVIYATKKDVLDAPGVDKDAAFAFFKTNKIRWNDPNSLSMVVDFLSTQLK